MGVLPKRVGCEGRHWHHGKRDVRRKKKTDIGKKEER